MYKRVVFGAVANPHVAELTDINRREFLMLALLAVLTLLMGLWPQPFVELIHPAVHDLLVQVSTSKLPVQ
jgi:NADH-quinone oxidoreductase subunit M